MHLMRGVSLVQQSYGRQKGQNQEIILAVLSKEQSNLAIVS
jgi:hypothetical protein